MKVDVLVLGAGIVGASIACHLAARGRNVALLDRKTPGSETSYGNAGVIERATLHPLGFPRDPKFLAKVALGLTPHAAYHWRALPRLARWLSLYRAATDPDGLDRTARTLFPLTDRSVEEHKALMAQSGALGFLRETGWIRLYREAASRAAEEDELRLARELGVPYVELDVKGTLALEPKLTPQFTSAIHWPSTASVSDPGAVTRSYADLALKRGARFLRGDAQSLVREGDLWKAQSEDGQTVEASEAVIALGPWSPDLVRRFGIDPVFAVKRGYHMHFSGRGLSRPIVDIDAGYVLAPMRAGIRLTTGVEFAERDAPPTPVQLKRAEPFARKLFPDLGTAVDSSPWLGRRPCLPDSLPVIGRAPGQQGLWLSFGHQHLGLTLGPVTGRMLAEMMTGETPVVDPAPFRVERFGAAGGPALAKAA